MISALIKLFIIDQLAIDAITRSNLTNPNSLKIFIFSIIYIYIYIYIYTILDTNIINVPFGSQLRIDSAITSSYGPSYK